MSPERNRIGGHGAEGTLGVPEEVHKPGFLTWVTPSALTGYENTGRTPDGRGGVAYLASLDGGTEAWVKGCAVGSN